MADQVHADQEVFGQVNFNEVVARSQATTMTGIANMFAMTSDRQSSIFLKKADEIDPVQAAAIRQVAYREAPIGAVAPS